MNLTRKHYAIIGAMCLAISTQLAGAKGGWSDVLTPLFLSGLLLQVGTMIGAIYVSAPGDAPKVEQATPDGFPKAAAILALCAVLASTSACGIKSQPGTFGGGALSAPSLLGDVQIVDRLEGDYYAQGALTPSVHEKVRLFVTVAEPVLTAMTQGATTLEAARAGLDALTLNPGVLAAARAAIDRAVIVHGAGGSALLTIRDAYVAMWSGLSIDGATHPDLVKRLSIINAVIAAIPLT